jgi:hypothetical protein
MLEDLLSSGDPTVLDDLDVLTDPARLRELARQWYQPAGSVVAAEGNLQLAPRREARRLLLAYLDRPLNPFHEPLVVRLFRRAYKAGDDEVMGRFLLLFDRSLRRKQRSGGKWVMRPSRMLRGRALGDAYIVRMPKGVRVLRLGAQERRDYEAYRLFAVATRLLLRKRAWRYFHRLGRERPQRYVAALAPVLQRCTDGDFKDEPAFLGRWCLLQVLFHHSDSIRPARRGSIWRKVSGSQRQWHEIPPAPAYEPLWTQQPEVLLELATEAPCRMVSLWAGRLLRRQGAEVLGRLSSAELFDRLSGPCAETVHAVAEVLLSRGVPDDVPVETWLTLLAARGEWALLPVLDLCERFLPPQRLALEQAVSLACLPFPLAAERGWRVYVAHHLQRGDADVPVLLRLLNAPVEPLRQEMAETLRRWLAAVEVPAAWLGAFVESPHAGVRAEGLRWVAQDHRLQEPLVWRDLAASSHGDVRNWCLEMLEAFQRGQPRLLGDALPLSAEGLRTLWARVLLTLPPSEAAPASGASLGPRSERHRGWGSPLVLVRQLVARLEWQPGESDVLLPMLAEVLQRSSGAVWQEALAGMVRLVERQPEWEAMVEQEVPGLVLRAPAADVVMDAAVQ